MPSPFLPWVFVTGTARPWSFKGHHRGWLLYGQYRIRGSASDPEPSLNEVEPLSKKLTRILLNPKKRRNYSVVLLSLDAGHSEASTHATLVFRLEGRVDFTKSSTHVGRNLMTTILCLGPFHPLQTSCALHRTPPSPRSLPKSSCA